jgi:hypothetical protein
LLFKDEELVDRVKNLPVFTAIVVAWAIGLTSSAVVLLAIAIVVARVPHSLVHIGVEQQSASPRSGHAT